MKRAAISFIVVLFVGIIGLSFDVYLGSGGIFGVILAIAAVGAVIVYTLENKNTK